MTAEDDLEEAELVGLAPHRLEALQELHAELALGARELLRAHRAAAERRDAIVDAGDQVVGRLPRLCLGVDGEQLGVDSPVQVRIHPGRDLRGAHHVEREARALAAGQEPRRHVERRPIRMRGRHGLVAQHHRRQLRRSPHHDRALAVLRRLTGVHRPWRRPAWNAAEELLHERQRRLRVDVAGQDHDGVVGRVVGLEVGLRLLQRDALEVLHEPDRVPAVGAALEGLQIEGLVHRTLDVVVDAEATLLHDDAALLLQVLRRDGQVGHPIGLEIEHHGQRLLRKVVQVRRHVARGEAVRGAAMAFDHVVEHPGAVLLAAVEHHVLEEVRDARGTGPLVARAGAEEDVRRDHRRRPVDVHQQPKPVVERELLDRDADSRDGCATRQQNRDGEDEASQHRAGLTR